MWYLLLFHCKYGCMNAPQCCIACLASNKVCSDCGTPTYLSKAWSKFGPHIFKLLNSLKTCAIKFLSTKFLFLNTIL